MKLAIVTQFPRDPEFPYGGVEAVSVNLVRGLCAFDDLSIDVVTLDKNSKTTDTYEWEGARIHRLPRKTDNELLNAISTGKTAISHYLDKLSPDIVHAHDTYGIMTCDITLPKVFTVHGFIYGDTILSNKKLPWLRSKLWKYIETRGWSKQPHIISISPYVRERVSQFSKAVIHDIDNPISSSFFDLQRQNSSNVIFSAAVISPRKNTLNLIYAVERLLDQGINVELRLAGSVSNPQYGELVEQAIVQHDLTDNVKLLGRITTAEIQKHLTESSIFALVSYEENSPMGIEEAMAAGVPVITSNMCGMPYMVKDGESGFLVNPSDVKDIARRMMLILDDDHLKTRMQECAKQIARDRFHPDVVARKTYNVYKDILASD
ncbi:MAG: glycosyltransferase family 4 protein [Candidatus Thiodiazotropha sp.]